MPVRTVDLEPIWAAYPTSMPRLGRLWVTRGEQGVIGHRAAAQHAEEFIGRHCSARGRALQF